MKKIIGIVIFFIALVANANDDIEIAKKAMQEGDFAIAYCIMRPLAQEGDVQAQYNIGWMYLNGYGLRVNDKLALQWWQSASQLGHKEASFSIAMLYSLGEGNVKENKNLAIDYYLLALEAGHEDALTMLKSMMQRNEKAMRSRIRQILNKHSKLFGIKKIVTAEKLNLRSRASSKSKLVSTIKKGALILEIDKKNKWSQIFVLDELGVDKIVWAYSSLLNNL